MFTRVVGPFPLCKPSLLLEVAAFQSSRSMSWEVGAAEVRVNPAQALTRDLASPWTLENFKGPLKPDHLAQGSANWQVPGPSEDPHFLQDRR